MANVIAAGMKGEIGEALTALREAAGLTQRELAGRMRANQTRISRIESGESDTDDVFSFLDALGTPGAEALAVRLRVEWKHLPRPSLRHPDFDALTAIEQALEDIRAFLGDGQVPAVLAGQAELLERRLEAAGNYLLALDHDVVYVGEIGVGKTTAACRQGGLVVDEATASDLKGMMLDTGGGRTTLCDVRVEAGERFALAVEPVSDEEVYKCVEEMCKSFHEKLGLESSRVSPEFKPAEEVERALRNMAGLLRPSRRKGVEPEPDPALELARRFSKFEDFSAEFAARLSLWRRKRRAVEFDGVDASAGRRWLRETFGKINGGRHDEFSLPARITVTVPFSLVPDERLGIAVVDTRGVDVSAVRPDILAHLRDERAVTLLCSKWGSAPDLSAQSLLTHVVETGADPLLLRRVAIIALARSGDASAMRHDSGESAANVSDGYEIKLGQVEDALHKIGMTNVDMFAFDAAADDPRELTEFVLKKIRALRKAQADAAAATIETAQQMLANREEAQALAAIRMVAGNLKRFAERKRALGRASWPVYERLLSAVTQRHPRTVWAATRRSGRFWTFDVFQYLGDGAAAEAKSRSSDVVTGLLEMIESDRTNPELASTDGFLAEIRANVGQWEADFVNAVRHHAVAIYQEPLSRAQALWAACENAYGARTGNYREEVADSLRRWFDQHAEFGDELDRRVGRAWETSFLAPLQRAAGLAPDVESG